jgi:glyoxylase-like metal-dependent hydrolase (beta-lactamase superfamily II)
MKLIIVDCNYVEPEFAAAALWVDQGRGFFVECNTNAAIPYLLNAVHEQGLSADAIEGLVITHVHLDHAGGAGLFLKTFPNAKVYAHPKAARHLIDPSRLITSATQVYGQEFMQRLYGEILACPAERVVILEDGDAIDWAGGRFETKHTRGHANHHLCVWEPQTRTLHTGDSFGVSYPKLNEHLGHVLFLVSTSPTDFDGDAALATIDWVESVKPNYFVPTHFGQYSGSQVGAVAEQLRAQIRFSNTLVQRIKNEALTEAQVIEEWERYLKQNLKLERADLKRLWVDIKVNSQGLVFAASKQT